MTPQNVPLAEIAPPEHVRWGATSASSGPPTNTDQSQASANSSNRARRSWWHWAMDTNLTLNVMSVITGLLGVIVAAIFGTATWIQSGDNHKSLMLGQWQSCVSNPTNPVSNQTVEIGPC
jgi:hypothetical protein